MKHIRGGTITAHPAISGFNYLGDEDQDHRDDERQQAEKFGSGEADEQATLLAIGRTRVAQRALEERTENVTHADGGHAGTDRGEARTDELCSFYFHLKLLWI
jgi:hypothetical protein